MTSSEFEKIAKNAVVKYLRENYIPVTIESLDIVWFAHELGYKKCTIWGVPMGNKYAEVTYNRDRDEIYVDIYEKISNTKLTSDEFNFEKVGGYKGKTLDSNDRKPNIEDNRPQCCKDHDKYFSTCDTCEFGDEE